MSDHDIKKYLYELQQTLPRVPPISTSSLNALHKAQNYKGMVQLIKKAMNLEDITFLVFWIPDGAAQQQERKDSPAWVELPKLPNELPFYGSAAFKQTSLKMYFRKSFLAGSAYDQVAIVIAHELSHVVLDSIRHPLKRVEKAVDLTAMLLGFRHLYISGAHKNERVGNSIRTHTIGYLSTDEVQLANQVIEASYKNGSTTKATSEPAGEQKKLSNFHLLTILGSVIFAFVLGWGAGATSFCTKAGSCRVPDVLRVH